MRGILVLAFIALTGMGGAATAGEIVYANGARVTGSLANEVLTVSTSTGLVEVLPEEVAVLRPGEVRLTSGEVLLGSIVGERVKVRTAVGELSIDVDHLEGFTAGAPPASRQPVAVTPTPPAETLATRAGRDAKGPESTPLAPVGASGQQPQVEAPPRALAAAPAREPAAVERESQGTGESASPRVEGPPRALAAAPAPEAAAVDGGIRVASGTAPAAVPPEEPRGATRSSGPASSAQQLADRVHERATVVGDAILDAAASVGRTVWRAVTRN